MEQAPESVAARIILSVGCLWRGEESCLSSQVSIPGAHSEACKRRYLLCIFLIFIFHKPLPDLGNFPLFLKAAG
jgi:hypothetical protein